MSPTELWLFGAILAAVTTAIGYLFQQQLTMRDRMEAIADAHLKDLWTAVNQIKVDLDVDRREREARSIAIATTMGSLASRDELNKQIDRMINEMDRRMNQAINRRGPIRDS